MTALSERKTKLTFETGAAVRERGKSREVIIECENAFYCYVRLKGTRTRLPISYDAIYCLAARKNAEALRAEKRAAKKASKQR